MNKAIITGNSRGLGQALVTQLESRGWSVLGLSRSSGLDLSSPEALVEWLDGDTLRTFLADATDVLLINNAAAVGPGVPVGQGKAADVVTAVNLNVTAPILLTEAVLAQRPDGVPVRVAHISSGAGRRAIEGWSVYCATKAAVDMHASTLAAEATDGVRAAAIAPGIVDTDMQASIRGNEGFPGREQFIEYKETGQLASPDDAAAAVLAVIDSPGFGQEPVTRI